MIRSLTILCLICSSWVAADAQFKDLFNKAKKSVLGEDISGEEAGLGLKEALELGVSEAVDRLAQEDGYFDSPYRILLPEEAKQVTDKLALVPGFQDAERELIQRMNRAAELAADRAKPIFLDAIKRLTFKDAMEILLGEVNAATTYLERTTEEALYGAFLPIIQESLDEVNARRYWRDASSAYNRIPFTKDVNTELDDHVTRTALHGMFQLIEQKERTIRGNKSARTSPLLQKVFAQQDAD